MRPAFDPAMLIMAAIALVLTVAEYGKDPGTLVIASPSGVAAR